MTLQKSELLPRSREAKTETGNSSDAHRRFSGEESSFGSRVGSTQRPITICCQMGRYPPDGRARRLTHGPLIRYLLAQRSDQLTGEARAWMCRQCFSELTVDVRFIFGQAQMCNVAELFPSVAKQNLSSRWRCDYNHLLSGRLFNSVGGIQFKMAVNQKNEYKMADSSICLVETCRVNS